MNETVKYVTRIIFGASWLPSLFGYIVAGAWLFHEFRLADIEKRDISPEVVALAVAMAGFGRVTKQVNKSTEDHNELG